MNKTLTIAMALGLTLTAYFADAQDVAPPIPPPAAIRIDGGKIQIEGDVRLREEPTAERVRVLAAPGLPAPGLPPIALFDRNGSFALQPDGRGNVTFHAIAALKLEKAAFLGLNASRAPAVLREQLKLKAGLVVDTVEPKSPADAAGLKPLDVLEKLDDQWLINSAQLSGLVRMHEPGETVTLSIIHKGDRTKLKAKLGERQMPVADDEPRLGLPGGMMFDGPREVSTWIDRGLDGPVVRAARTLLISPDSQGVDAAYQDPRLVLRLVRNDGKTVLIANDKSGKIIFEGPIDTPQEREKLPQDVRAKMERLEKTRAEFERAERLREEVEKLRERDLDQLQQREKEPALPKAPK